MTDFQDAKAREDFTARCDGLQIKAKEKKQNPVSPFTNGIAFKHPGHYRAPANSSFERQCGYIGAQDHPSSRSSSQHKASATSPTFEAIPNFAVAKPATSKPLAVARQKAIAKCHRELATCYEKLAALHALEAEEADANGADVVKRAQAHLNNGTLQLEMPLPFN